MQNPINKSILSLLFLSAFLFLRVTNAHTYSHFGEDENDIHCELCDIIVNSQDTTPFSSQTSFQTTTFKATFVVVKKMNSAYNVPLHCIVTPTSVYNKPPPVLG